MLKRRVQAKDRDREARERALVAVACSRHGVILTPDVRVDIEHLGDGCYVHVGDGPCYGILAKHEDQGVKIILYVSAELCPDRLTSA